MLDSPLADRLHRTTVLHVVSDYDRFHDMYPLGLLTAGLNPSGQVLMPLWLAEVDDSPLAHRLHRASPVRTLFAEDVLPGGVEGQEAEFCQITSDTGLIWQRSRSLGDHSFSLDRKTVARLGLWEWCFDDTKLSSGINVRRITYKARLPLFALAPPWGGRSPLRADPDSDHDLARVLSCHDGRPTGTFLPPTHYARRPSAFLWLAFLLASRPSVAFPRHQARGAAPTVLHQNLLFSVLSTRRSRRRISLISGLISARNWHTTARKPRARWPRCGTGCCGSFS